MIVQSLVDSYANTGLSGVHFESPLWQCMKNLPLGLKGIPGGFSNSVNENLERSLRGHCRVKLTKRPCCRISWIGEFGLSLFFSSLIQLAETSIADEDLSTHYKSLWRFHPLMGHDDQRDFLDGLDVRSDILSSLTITSRRCYNQTPTFIDEFHCKSIKLRFSNVHHFGEAQLTSTCRVE